MPLIEKADPYSNFSLQSRTFYFLIELLESLSLIFDTGCLILIWLVQLVIYPSFQYYSPLDLKKWHSKYTGQITVVVLPLMVGQLITSSMLAYLEISTLNLTKLALVLTNWVLTFVVFVPLHQKLEHIAEPLQLTKALIVKNWLRTIIWSLIFLLTLLEIL